LLCSKMLSLPIWKEHSSTIESQSKTTGDSKLCIFPGQFISVDQLESPTPSLIVQLKGIPTTKRYTVATVFIDHFSRLFFVHLQSTLSSGNTIEAKKAFERYSESHGVKVRYYHADNGRFLDQAFIEDIRLQNQKVTYCSVNLHFQCRVAEKCIGVEGIKYFQTSVEILPVPFIDSNGPLILGFLVVNNRNFR
jgi:hypothetical protein